MTVRSSWLTEADACGSGQSREDTRLSPIGTMTPTGELTTRGGVLPGGDGFALAPVSGMQCAIGQGRAVVQGRSTQGAYPVVITKPEVVVFADGDPQYPRIDVVALRVYDAEYDAISCTSVRVEVIPGTPATHPTTPAVSGTAEILYEVTIPAGASVVAGGLDWPRVVRDRRRSTVAVGGILAGGWSDSWSGAYPGQYRDAGGGLERWDGQSWTPYPAPELPAAWVPVSLADGFENDGNGAGPLRYRRITLAGVDHMQWRGGVSWSKRGDPPNDGALLSKPVPERFRPERHTPVAAAAGGVPLKADFTTAGQVRLIVPDGVTTWASLTGVLYPLDR